MAIAMLLATFEIAEVGTADGQAPREHLAFSMGPGRPAHAAEAARRRSTDRRIAGSTTGLATGRSLGGAARRCPEPRATGRWPGRTGGPRRSRPRGRPCRRAARPSGRAAPARSATPPTWTSSSVSAPVGSTTITSAWTEASRPGDRQVLGPHAVGAPPGRRCPGRRPRPASARCRRPRPRPAPPWRRSVPDDDVHRRRADELGHEQVVRPVVELERRADLLDPAVLHHDDLVGHRHRLDLVVRDVDRRRLQALVQRLDLGAHRDPQLGVEVRQRLVEQEDLRVAHDRAPHRDALALPARELARVAMQVVVEVQDLRRLRDALRREARVGLRRRMLKPMLSATVMCG